MIDEYWESSPFGKDSIFNPSFDEKQKEERVKREEKANRNKNNRKKENNKNSLLNPSLNPPTLNIDGMVNGPNPYNPARINNMNIKIQAQGLVDVKTMDITQFVQVTFSGTLEEGKRTINSFDYKGVLYNKDANTATYLDPGQFDEELLNPTISYWDDEEKDALFAKGFHGRNTSKTTAQTAFFDQPSNVNEDNFGYRQVLFTTYISVVNENDFRTVLGKIYWSYNYDFETRKWKPNPRGEPIVIPTNEFSETAKKILQKLRISF